MKSIDDTNKPKKGRPPVQTEAINLRLHVDLISLIDDFRRGEKDLPSRPEAIRRLLNDKLIGIGLKKPE